MPTESRQVARRRLNSVVAAEPSQAIDYDDAVREAKQIVARADGDQMRLAELADSIETRYGEETLKQFARAVGVAACTLKRRRTVYRAWKEIGAPAPQLYSVAQELAAHPDRFEIVRNQPNITKREARKLMRAHRRAEAVARPRDWQLENHRRWFNAVIKHAEDVIRDGALADSEVHEPLRSILREVIQPGLLPTLREGGEAAIRLADFLARLSAEPDQEEPIQQNFPVKLAQAAE